MDEDKSAESDPRNRIQHHPRILRRRDLAASMNIPPGLEEAFDKFTNGELAVLKIIANEVVRHGVCTLTKNAIANLSCTSHTVVKVAFRIAKAEGLITVERTGRHNTITITPTWKAWLSRYGDGPPDGPLGSGSRPMADKRVGDVTRRRVKPRKHD
jgi:hypothetical protein